MAEREGFEPPVELPPRLISSQVHSATLPPLRGAERASARTASVTKCASPRHLPPVEVDSSLNSMPSDHEVFRGRMVDDNGRGALFGLKQVRGRELYTDIFFRP